MRLFCTGGRQANETQQGNRNPGTRTDSRSQPRSVRRSASPYSQGKTFATQSQDPGVATTLTALQSWCAVNNPNEGTSWDSGCEAGYFQRHPSDYQNWGPGSTASAAPSAQAPAPTTPAPAKTIIVQPAPARTVYVAPAAPAAPVYSGANCGGLNGHGLVYAGPNTSCSFALNVAGSYSGPGSDSEYVYSPVTGQSYLMTYTQSGNEIYATGGNNASVQFGSPY